MMLKSGVVTFSFSRSLCFALCLTLILSGVPLPTRTQASQTPQDGLRTTEAPSKNLPDLDATRARKEPEVKKPEPIPATRCRHWDNKCKTLKNEKVSGLFDQDDQNRKNSNRSQGLIAAASGNSFGKAFDWRASAFTFDSNPKAWNRLQPVRQPEQTEVRSTKNSRSTKPGIMRKDLPRAFASSLLPAMALQTYSNAETARVEPQNRTGNPGEDLLSGNFNFSIPIINLPGRNGHDLNLTLTYNSKVWTKINAYTIRFDMDYGWPSPGFRLGLPTFYGTYTNSTTNRLSFGVILPSGRAIELRQVSNLTETYDSEDGSYIRLKHDAATGSYILMMADGTQYIYGATLDIKDRNGNLITVAFDANGSLDTITDTLGRQILFQYGSYYELLKIQQIWNGVSKDLATFDYDSLNQLMFRFTSGLVPDNVTNMQRLPVISQVTLLDNTRYKFQYNTYGQINRYEKYGGLTFLRAWTQYNLPTYSDGSIQSDCPGFTARTDWAYDWSAAGGVVTSFQFNQSVANPDVATESANPNLTGGQVTTPDGTTYKELYYGLPATTARWRYGLLKMTETWTDSNTKKRKMTKTHYEQPCGGGSIGNWLAQCNPRVIESNIYDNTDNNNSNWEKQRRTTVSYAAGNPTDFNLPADVYEYDYPSTTTVLRRTHTDYNQTSTYINKRIIGLPSASMLYDGAGVLNSKVEYVYDESGYLQAHTTTPIQRDTANYGIGYLAGRGNLTTVRRYNVNDNTSVEAKTGYYVTGTVAFSRDALNHQTTIDYTDGFCALTSCTGPPQNKNSYAYPTKVTDPDNYSSYVYYNFDLGAPAKTINPKGASVLRQYDGYGRLWQITNQVNGAYTRYDFDSLQNFVKSYSTIQDGQGEFYSITTFDGHERPRAAVSEHPGSAGGYKAVYNGYDTMGRQSQVSNPTEINSAWTPAGDDVVSGSNGGWRWSLQSYDWKGRPTYSYNQDHTTQNPSYREISYTGCGCAGGDVTTLTDEGTIDNGVAKRRQQIISKDVLGRVVKTQWLNWQNGNPYLTTFNTYNVRDQITSVKEYNDNDPLHPVTGNEACPSPICQKTSLNYDGHGRLQSRQAPIESAATTYSYFADDRQQIVTDARGASATFTYNNRGLVMGITYGRPAEIAATPNVTFGYDEVGNRTWMDDGPGRVDYNYDSLSRLQTEARQFDGLTGSYQFTYTYNLAGQVSTITDNRFNNTLTYNHDKAGQLASLTGTGFEGNGQSNFISPTLPVKYRAWGGVKEVNYGDNLKSTFSFNSRLQPTSYRLLNAQSQAVVDGSDYQYYSDGRTKFASNLGVGNALITPANAFDRAYKYDHVGRLAEASTGPEARGEALPPAPPPPNNPYKQNNTYDAWGNLTGRANRFWRVFPNDSGTYANNRRQGWQYDQAGNILADTNYHAYDAASRQVSENSGLFYIVGGGNTGNPQLPSVEISQSYDGDGLPVKRVETKRTEALVGQGPQTTITTNVTIAYQIRPRINGGKQVLEVDSQGAWVKGFIYAAGVRIAENPAAYSGGPRYVNWQHSNPVTGTLQETYGQNYGRTEFDPFGASVGSVDPYFGDPTPTYLEMRAGDTLYIDGGDPFDLSGGCTLDGLPVSCNFIRPLANSDVAVHAPGQTTRFNYESRQYEFFSAFANGYQGFLPLGVTPNTNGVWYDPISQKEGVLQKSSDPVSQAVKDCDKILASLFGGLGAVAQSTVGRNATTGEYSPAETDHQDDIPVPQGGAIHIYAPSNIPKDVGAFIPYKPTSISGAKYRPDDKDVPSYHFFEFAYKNGYGNYKSPFTVYVFHLKDVDINGQLSIDENIKNADGSIRIGNIGGPGGMVSNSDGTPLARHIHITARAYRQGDGIGSGAKSQFAPRIDIRKIFCTGF